MLLKEKSVKEEKKEKEKKKREEKSLRTWNYHSGYHVRDMTPSHMRYRHHARDKDVGENL